VYTAVGVMVASIFLYALVNERIPALESRVEAL
jgi:hypothetical protein